MEIVTHLINDTIEFYKWGLTIAGEICQKDVSVCVCVFACLYTCMNLNEKE